MTIVAPEPSLPHTAGEQGGDVDAGAVGEPRAVRQHGEQTRKPAELGRRGRVIFAAFCLAVTAFCVYQFVAFLVSGQPLGAPPSTSYHYPARLPIYGDDEGAGRRGALLVAFVALVTFCPTFWLLVASGFAWLGWKAYKLGDIPKIGKREWLSMAAVAATCLLAAPLFRLGGPIRPYPLTNSLHIFNQGDFWQYTVSGTATKPSGQDFFISGGSSTSTITSADYGQFIQISEQDEMEATLTNGVSSVPMSVTQHEVLNQDPVSGTVYLLSDDQGEQGAVRHALKPQIDTPGAWSDGLSQSDRVDFDNGEWQNQSLQVDGTEVVRTAIGSLTCWKATQQQTDSSGATTTTLLWYAPQLGLPVRQEITTKEADGSVLVIKMDLTKTNVPQ